MVGLCICMVVLGGRRILVSIPRRSGKDGRYLSNVSLCYTAGCCWSTSASHAFTLKRLRRGGGGGDDRFVTGTHLTHSHTLMHGALDGSRQLSQHKSGRLIVCRWLHFSIYFSPSRERITSRRPSTCRSVLIINPIRAEHLYTSTICVSRLGEQLCLFIEDEFIITC